MDRRTARSYNDQGLQAGVSIPAPISPRTASVKLLFTMLHPRCDASGVMMHHVQEYSVAGLRIHQGNDTRTSRA